MSQQKIYPMKEWHLENMKKTVIKYVTGLLDTATLYQRKQHKKYSGNLSKVHKSIAFDANLLILEIKKEVWKD
jgi:hypothetical protein